MGDMSIQRSVRFPEGLVERIEKLAAGQDRPFSYLVVKACEEKYLTKAEALEKVLAAQTKAPELSEPTGASPSPAPPRASETTLYACPKATCIFTAISPGVCPHHRNLALKPQEVGS